MKVITVPLTFLRDYTIPMAEEETWDRTRASVLPSTMVISFFYLFGMLNDVTNEDDDDAREMS